jgi:hypothetical protein
MMGIETRARLFCVNPIVSLPFSLDLVLIEPSRRPMAPGARLSCNARRRKPPHQPPVGKS